jgi:tetratricopeptide (TPR) repeat protein
MLESIDPTLYEEALYEGRTIQSLLEMGVGGLQAFVSEEEGFFSGLIRGEHESLLATPVGERVFSVIEQATAAAGGMAGFLQGVGDSIIGNIKGIIDLFTPTFWGDLKKFLTEFLPNFALDNGFRFLIGQLMGQASAEELRRLGTADPFEYGRTIGHAIGFALTETVLSFIGLGWVLKSLRGTRLLEKISESIMVVVRRVAKSAIAVKAFDIAKAVGEGLNALRDRLRRLKNRLPAVTAAGRMDRAVAELEDAERAAMAAYREAIEAEKAAQHALSKGDYETAQEQLEIFSRKLDELEPHAGASRPDAEPRKITPTAKTEAAEEAADVVGGVNKETLELLERNDELRHAVERYPKAARAFKHCGSYCLPPIPPATADDYARFERLLDLAEDAGISFDFDELGRYFRDKRDNLTEALDDFESLLGEKLEVVTVKSEAELGSEQGAIRTWSRKEGEETRVTRYPDAKDPTESYSIGAYGEHERAAELGRSYRKLTQVIPSKTERQQLLKRLNDPDDEFSLMDFAEEVARKTNSQDGVGQVRLKGETGARDIDHIFIEGDRVILMEYKTVTTFRERTKILKQLRIDKELLKKHPEAEVRWRVTIEEKDVPAEFMSKLLSIMEEYPGRFTFVFGKP